MVILAVWILGALLLSGLVLVVVGWRGRVVNDHPCCRGCGFDLVGVYPGGDRCPECGKELGEGAIHRGQRKRRRGPIAVGFALFFASLAIVSTIAIGTASGTNWNAYKPTGWLIRQARSGTPTSIHSAVEELSIRYAADELGDSSIERIIDAGLAFQADRARTTWEPLWGNLIEAMGADGHLADEQLAVYWRQAFTITPHLQKRVRPDKPLAIVVFLAPDRCGDGTSISCSAAMQDIWVNGSRTYSRSPNAGSAGYMTSQRMSGGGSSSTRTQLPPKLGSNTVTITWICSAGEPNVNPSISENFYSRWTVEETFQVEVIAEPDPLVTWISDPEMSRHLNANTSISRVAPQIDETSPSVYVSVRVEAPPVAMAMDVVLSVEGSETHLFYLTLPAGSGPHDSGGVIRLDSTPTDGIVILRPSEDALGILESDEVFGEELRFPITIIWPVDE